MKRLLAAFCAFVAFSAAAQQANDMRIDQRNASNTSWLSRVVPVPEESALLTYDDATQRPIWTTAGDGISITGGVISSTVPAGPPGPQGPQGPAGTVNAYNSAGQIAGLKMWLGTATANSSGDWTVDYSSAGFTEVISVYPSAVSKGDTLADRLIASNAAAAPTLTSASGHLMSASAAGLLVAVTLTQSAGTVRVIVMGR